MYFSKKIKNHYMTKNTLVKFDSRGFMGSEVQRFRGSEVQRF